MSCAMQSGLVALGADVVGGRGGVGLICVCVYVCARR